MMASLIHTVVRFHVPDDRLPPISNVHPFDADDLRSAAPQPTQRLNQGRESARQHIAEAKAFRDIEHRHAILLRKQFGPSESGGPLTAEERLEESELGYRDELQTLGRRLSPARGNIVQISFFCSGRPIGCRLRCVLRSHQELAIRDH
jgi:hypothetical protein